MFIVDHMISLLIVGSQIPQREPRIGSGVRVLVMALGKHADEPGS